MNPASGAELSQLEVPSAHRDGDEIETFDGATLFGAAAEAAQLSLPPEVSAGQRRRVPAGPPVQVPAAASADEPRLPELGPPGSFPARSRAQVRAEPRSEPSSAAERQRRPKRTRAAASAAQAGQQVAGPAGFAAASARELAAQLSATWAQSRGPHSTVAQYQTLSPESIFELLNNERNGPCQGARPKIVSGSDAGKVFLERAEGAPGSARKARRQSGLQKWNQGDVLWMKRVEPYRYGPGNCGEIWAKATYGQVVPREAPDDSAAKATPQKLRYNMYELHWFNNGRADPGVAPVRTGGGSQRRQRNDHGDKADWIQGVLYQVKKAKGHDVAAASVAKPPNTVWGTQTMQLENGDRKWIQFDDQNGMDKGAIQLSAQGRLELESTAGDFAEYYPIDPSEAQCGGPFEEGDIVGFGANGLTRRTKGARQLGVITRRAIIKGSRPSAGKDLSQFDTVAHVGIVPVKVRSMSTTLSWRGSRSELPTGSHVAPSGLEDGTGVVVRGFPRQCVGRTVAAGSTSSSAAVDPPAASSCMTRVLCCVWNKCCRKSWVQRCSRSPAPSASMNGRLKADWQLVSIAVVDPTRSVSEGITTAQRTICGGLCGALLFVYLLLYFLPCTYFGCRCDPVVLAHGQLRGTCEGTVGSSCRYESCDSGYVLMPAARDVDEYDFAPSDEMNRMVASYGDCKTLQAYEKGKEKETDLTAALELQGWTCYRHGVGAGGIHSGVNDARAAAHHGQTNYEWGWCISMNHTSYCAIKPPLCRVCDHAALGSGWRNCEFSGALDGPERVCMQPNDWLYTGTGENLDGLVLPPVIDNCWLNPQHGDSDSASDSWIATSAFEAGPIDIDKARRYHTAEVCTLPSASGHAGVTRNSSSADRRRMQSAHTSNGAAGTREKLDMGVHLDMECRAASFLHGAAFYAGTPMQCVELHCPAEAVSLRSIQACQKCEDKDAIVHFPRTRAIAADAASSTNTVTLSCPAGFRGSVSRTCGTDGRWSATSGACTRLHCARLHVPLVADFLVPSHIKETCQSDLEIPGGWVTKFACLHLLQKEVVIDEALEGTGTVFARCPWPSHVGSMSAVCLPGATTWTSIRGQCALQSCPATRIDVNGGNRTFAVRLPQQVRTPDVPVRLGTQQTANGHWNIDTLQEANRQGSWEDTWAVIPCCSEWTNTGSCIDDAGAIGWLLSQCTETEHGHEYGDGTSSSPASTRRIYEFSEADRAASTAGFNGRDVNLGCKPLESLIGGVKLDHGPPRSASDLTGVPAGNAQDRGNILYRALASNVDSHIRNSTNGQWSLPRTGILSSVSVAARQHIGQPAFLKDTTTGDSHNGHAYVDNPWQWRPVVASASESSKQSAISITIDATLSAALKAGPPVHSDDDDDDYEQVVYSARRSAGRAAAAFADATCQQMNYSRAVLVTTCKALHNAVVGRHMSRIPHEDLEWWNSRSTTATYNGSRGSVRLSLDDIEGAQGVPLLAELCPEIIEHTPEPAAGQREDGTVDAHSFGKISSAAQKLQCSTWLDVDRYADHPDPGDAWLNTLTWNREHPRNYSLRPYSWLTGEEAAEAAIASATGNGTTSKVVPDDDRDSNLFPSYSSCSGHPKEAEDISRCFVAQLQRRLDYPHAIDAQGKAVSDDRPCINKIIVGCSNERPHVEAARPADEHETKGQQEYARRHEGVWAMGDQHGPVEGNWLAPKIFTDFGGPYDCATGASAAGQNTNACHGKLLEYWAG